MDLLNYRLLAGALQIIALVAESFMGDKAITVEIGIKIKTKVNCLFYMLFT